ncbi:hypothetical protein [Pasteurella sp. PK-2025]|uniref:hypothetical protein n=1 Tax=Pasteurella sp. PK-2025 TaxID=3413133 RepID=UPI003C713AC4
MMAIPRVDHEVLLNFLDSNPNQLLVMGQTYKGKGGNGILMENAKTGRRLDFQAQKA